MIYNMSRAPSTLYSNLLRRNTNAELQTRLSQAEQELSTGVKTDIYKSLGTAASEALALNASLERDAAQIVSNNLLAGRLESMSGAIAAIRETVQPAMELALANGTSAGGTVDGLHGEARMALDALISQANATHAGMSLFSGTAHDQQALTPWEIASSTTGEPPSAAFEAILAAGLETEADVTARIAEIDALFDNADGSFDALFGFDSAATGLSASIGDGETVRLDVQANDPAFRDVVQGLAMLAAIDATEISDSAAYGKWVAAASAKMTAGMEGLLDSQVRLDSAAARIETVNTRMQDRAVLYATRVDELVGVDSYQAATDITALETQLQASYAVTARLSQLSFLNFMS